ncbi:tripartite tricarboxylate transporter substrate binding protein [Terrihabitans rhizophilus]|uniref:Tripartite tricarboxylate transporter substrate binding protein n=1 Tax=Terrihabitans rhizophilus TaxID=3092662 RepID=A0ABU4RL59_9HYPH|nr:tripartite tricarboxylate transporter substrate binding protein [Terrihabitans sp. PJ23]MDX6805542.1 tripartite tricarboxylate transporter substrate binding protein [Terrihabitans sp. PJ23]
MRVLKLALAGACALVSALVPAAAQTAADWPKHPIEFVCATNAGSGAANWCLLMAELAGAELGKPVEVLFKAGGAGNEGASYVDERPADGYTWLQRNTSYAGYMSLPTFRPNPMNFEVVADIEKFLFVVAVPASSKYKTFEDLIADMKARPGQVTVAANKPGSAHHLHLDKLFRAFGVKWSYVPYDGAGDAMKDTLGGHVDAAIGPPGIWQPHVDAGKARYLLLINEERLNQKGLADIRVPSELGVNYPITHQLQGVFLKKGTPPDVEAKIVEALKRAVETPRYKDYLAKNSHVIPSFNADKAAATAAFHEERKTMGDTLRAAGLLK